ncbi:hypothetical protein [Peribacillus simplex]|uniref:hypothetical protein n=1 Tax=Peribacillus simplex TaxID=1478 RepID=UPI003D289BDD
MLVKINEIEIDAKVDEQVEKDEQSGKSFIKYQLDFTAQGKNNYVFISGLLKKDEVHLVVEEKGINFTAKRIDHSSTYKNILEENTIVYFGVSYREKTEVDEVNDNDWSVLNGIYINSLRNWVRTRALAELLEDKGIISAAEYLEKLDVVAKRDKDEMEEFFKNGPKEDK